jgi:hypothetical protein
LRQLSSIPSSLHLVPHSEILQVQHNFFSGAIPSELGALPQLANLVRFALRKDPISLKIGAMS